MLSRVHIFVHLLLHSFIQQILYQRSAHIVQNLALLKSASFFRTHSEATKGASKLSCTRCVLVIVIVRGQRLVES